MNDETTDETTVESNGKTDWNESADGNESKNGSDIGAAQDRNRSGDHVVREIGLSPAADLSPYISGWQVVSAALGYDDRAYVLLVDEEPEPEEGFTPAELNRSSRYKALIVDIRHEDIRGKAAEGNEEASMKIEEVVIEGETFNYHYLQPLEDELLLVGARSRYYERDRYDMNAAVFDRNGLPLRRFLVGDGIQNVQTTAGGLIWTSFFDEGVFGNYGWARPVGESGLIAWDRSGIRVFTNSEADIIDCYALNAVSDEEVWFYYYVDFKLCRLKGPASQPNISFLDPQLKGSSVFATDGMRFLLDSGYDKDERYTLLLQDEPGRLVRGGEIVLTDERGRRLQVSRQDARGQKLLLMDETKLYLFELDQLE